MKSLIMRFSVLVVFVGSVFATQEAKLEEFLDITKEIESQNIAVPEKNIILIGSTGSGKSSLANLICGVKLKALEREHEFQLVLDTVSDSVAKIGHKHNKSTTKELKMINISDNVGLWDCTGFFDSDGEMRAYRNAFALYKLLRDSKEFKIVLVVTEEGMKFAKGFGINKSIKILKNMFGEDNIEQLCKCLTIVVTKQFFLKKELLESSIMDACKSFKKVITDGRYYIMPSPEIMHLKKGELVPESFSNEINEVLQKSEFISDIKIKMSLSAEVRVLIGGVLQDSYNATKLAIDNTVRHIGNPNNLATISLDDLNTVNEYADHSGSMDSLKLLLKNPDDQDAFLRACDRYRVLSSFGDFLINTVEIRLPR